MKIRDGFVANSSSSSFIISGWLVETDKLIDTLNEAAINRIKRLIDSSEDARLVLEKEILNNLDFYDSEHLICVWKNDKQCIVGKTLLSYDNSDTVVASLAAINDNMKKFFEDLKNKDSVLFFLKELLGDVNVYQTCVIIYLWKIRWGVDELSEDQI